MAAGYTDIADDLCHPVPYQLVGGPNKADNPDISPFPARCYEDIADPEYDYLGNYALNENAVNIRAAIIALTGYFSTGGAATGVSENAGEVGPGNDAGGEDLILAVGRPNPFGRETVLRFRIPRGGPVRLSAHDVSGRLVRTLEDRVLPPDWYSVAWDGSEEGGRTAAAGVYLVRLECGGAVRRAKVVRLR